MLDSSGGPSIITWVLKSQEMWQKKGEQDSISCCLKMEDPSGKHEKEMNSASTLNAPGSGFSTELPGGTQPAKTLVSALWGLHQKIQPHGAGFWPREPCASKWECVPYIYGNLLREQEKTNKSWKQITKETLSFTHRSQNLLIMSPLAMGNYPCLFLQVFTAHHVSPHKPHTCTACSPESYTAEFKVCLYQLSRYPCHWISCDTHIL